MAACTVKGEVFFDETKKTSASLHHQSISYKSMDAYRGMFVLSTINGLCAWHQAIARPFNNKNLNAKLMCDFGVTRFIFLCSLCGPKG